MLFWMPQEAQLSAGNEPRSLRMWVHCLNHWASGLSPGQAGFYTTDVVPVAHTTVSNEQLMEPQEEKITQAPSFVVNRDSHSKGCCIFTPAFTHACSHGWNGSKKTSTQHFTAVVIARTVKRHKRLTLHAAVQQFDNDRSSVVLLEVNKQWYEIFFSNTWR